jgi:hypothetical protein
VKPSKAMIAGAAVAGLLTGSVAVRAHAAPPPATGIFSYSLPSALNIDIEHDTVTLPLQEGRTTDGRRTWYIVTESSDQADAARRGVNYSNKLLNAVGTAAVQKVTSGDHGLVFPGTVDFSLTHVLVPGPNGFPPAEFAPGAAGDANYSPLGSTTRTQTRLLGLGVHSMSKMPFSNSDLSQCGVG